MSKLTIGPKHPVRRAIANLPDYYSCLADAAWAARKVLADYDLRMDDPVWDGDSGWTNPVIRPAESDGMICECCAEKMSREGYANVVHFSYYKCREGRWEVISYIS